MTIQMNSEHFFPMVMFIMLNKKVLINIFSKVKFVTIKGSLLTLEISFIPLLLRF